MFWITMSALCTEFSFETLKNNKVSFLAIFFYSVSSLSCQLKKINSLLHTSKWIVLLSSNGGTYTSNSLHTFCSSCLRAAKQTLADYNSDPTKVYTLPNHLLQRSNGRKKMERERERKTIGYGINHHMEERRERWISLIVSHHRIIICHVETIPLINK